MAATDDWRTARTYVASPVKPRLVVVDLQDLSDARGVLDELQTHMPPDRVLVLTALGTIAADDLRQRGVHVVARPAAVADVVSAAVNALMRRR